MTKTAYLPCRQVAYDNSSHLSGLKINAQALVNIRESILIGGYNFMKNYEDDSGVPVLTSIPIIGNLFKTQNKSSLQKERLVLITLRIV
jgi:type II secretory pathway component GspD/PulD (secretin)